MKKFTILLFYLLIKLLPAEGQEPGGSGGMILFHGLIMDARSEIPLPNSHIIIKRSLVSVSDHEGKFAFYVNRSDTVFFTNLGYRSTALIVSDTLSGREFVAGVYMRSDTISIGEVIIVPRLANLRSEMLGPKTEASKTVENAKYNLAVSAYQGRMSQSKLGDPSLNYEVLRRQQRTDAYSRGQIPADMMVGLSPLMLIPAAYLLINGLPEKPPPLQPRLTEQEVNEIHKKYLENQQAATGDR